MALWKLQRLRYADPGAAFAATIGEAAGRGRAALLRTCGAVLIALGVLIKIWPGLLLLGLPRSRRGLRTGVKTAVALAVGLGALLLIFPDGLGFLHNQQNRGIEVESVPGALSLLAMRLGLWRVRVGYAYGSYQVFGHGMGIAADIMELGTAVVFVLLVWWWFRARWRAAAAADVALVATLAMIATSRVISPQYLIWVLALAGLCRVFADSSQRRSSALVLCAAALTQVEFPELFTPLCHHHWVAVLVVNLRNLLLVLAVVVGLRDLWRSTSARTSAAGSAEASAAASVPAPSAESASGESASAASALGGSASAPISAAPAAG